MKMIFGFISSLKVLFINTVNTGIKAPTVVGTTKERVFPNVNYA